MNENYSKHSYPFVTNIDKQKHQKDRLDQNKDPYKSIFIDLDRTNFDSNFKFDTRKKSETNWSMEDVLIQRLPIYSKIKSDNCSIFKTCRNWQEKK